MPLLKPKVLFVIDTLRTGGAEQSLLDNVSRFRRLAPIVCHLYTGADLKPQFVKNGIKVYSIELKGKYAFPAACRKLAQVIRQERPDLLVAYLTRSEIVTRVVAKWFHLPVIGTFVSDLYAPVYNGNLSRASKMAVQFFRNLNKLTARLCKGFIANSEAVKRSNAQVLDIPLQKIEVINRGRDSHLFNWRSPTHNAGKIVRFLNIGRLVHVKGQRDLLLAFTTFLSIFPLAELHIAGDGPCKKALLQLIDENKLHQKVFLLGNRTDLPALIHDYDCFVFPSLSEGFSGSVIEAMLAGLPVLASDIPVNREILIHMETGYLFEPGAPGAILEALLWFTGNRAGAAAMAVKARACAVANFELETVAAKLEYYLCSQINIAHDDPAPGAKASIQGR